MIARPADTVQHGNICIASSGRARLFGRFGEWCNSGLPSMRKYLVAIFSILLITPAIANDVDLSKGDISREYGRTKQALSLRNNTARPLNEVWAECDFFRGDELVGKGIASFRNVLPGQTSYDQATSAGGDITRTDCHIENPDE